MKKLQLLVMLVFALGLASCQKQSETEPKQSLLVFSKTTGYRHESIPAGIAALQKLGSQLNYDATATEDASVFTFEQLKTFDAVVFLNTTGDVLNEEQQLAFESYIQAGGGFVGIHAAADTEWQDNNDWYWYRRLVGGIFMSHPSNPSNVQEATLNVVDAGHASTKDLPQEFKFSDEWYDFKYLNPARKDLITVDESTYEEGKQGDYHPIAWYHDFDGGRSFYTNLGHKDETFSDPVFIQHLSGGLKYAFGDGSALNEKAIRPAHGDFHKKVLSSDLNEPMSLDFFANGDILVVERPGTIKHFDREGEELRLIGEVKTPDVPTHFEMGLQGVAIDEQANGTTYIYLSYTEARGEDLFMRLSRFNWVDNTIDFASEQMLFDYQVDANCCHMGGDIELTQDGLLLMSTGDNTSPRDQDGYNPIDFRDLVMNDALRSSGNTQDLRGKVLRIRPLAEGGYEIPEGNLFTDAAEGRPEIYVMGTRNAFTITYDDRSGDLFYGDVGPDAREDKEDRGPQGHDEVNRITEAGNFGWPLFIGDNKQYVHYDFVKGESTGNVFDLEKPENISPRNTGARFLPPAKKALIWYPYGLSEEFPELGVGGRTALVADVYHAEDYAADTRYPEYFNGRLFILDFIRRWVKVVSYDENNNVTKIEDFAPHVELVLPIDGRFGPDGNLYVLEYGSGWFKDNPDARLVRIDYTPGSAAEAAAVAAKAKAAAPEGHQFADEPHPGKKLLTQNACLSCHKIGGESVGPDLVKVAAKYKEQADAQDYLSGKIAAGSAGVWGGAAMPPFAHLPEAKRKLIAEYILTLE